jgi:dynein heavy chain, axonemal
MKDVYGPRAGKTLVLCVDDLNMPRMDRYGTQQPLAFLRLFLDRQV